MIPSGRPLCGVLLLTIVLGGCSMLESPQSATRRVKRMFTPNPTDWDTADAQDKGEWDFVGEEGRGSAEREKDPDSAVNRLLMSDRALEISRNLGVDGG